MRFRTVMEENPVYRIQMKQVFKVESVRGRVWRTLYPLNQKHVFWIQSVLGLLWYWNKSVILVTRCYKNTAIKNRQWEMPPSCLRLRNSTHCSKGFLKSHCKYSRVQLWHNRTEATIRGSDGDSVSFTQLHHTPTAKFMSDTC